MRDQTGQDARRCYQCGKCTAGCPIAYAMDFGPQRVMRCIQFDMRREVLSSNTIWLCVNCELCAARCPQMVHVPAVMDGLRQIAVREGVRAAENHVFLASRSFLDGIRDGGRQHELGFVLRFKLASRKFFADLGLGLDMMRHHKLPLTVHRNGARAEIRRIFERAATRNVKHA